MDFSKEFHYGDTFSSRIYLKGTSPHIFPPHLNISSTPPLTYSHSSLQVDSQKTMESHCRSTPLLISIVASDPLIGVTLKVVSSPSHQGPLAIMMAPISH